MPLLLLSYILNSLDRSNVGIAQIHLQRDLRFTPEVYGFGVGIFFFGYLLFAIPSNLVLDKIGIRKTVSRIMVCWGAFSTATMLVHTPAQFYAVRFLLGVAEAGFFPGVMLYLSYWYPSTRRAGVMALFFLALPLSSIISAALSGWILQNFEGYYSLHGWQWMFLLEGLPSIGLGIICYFYLDNRPTDAKWLRAAEKMLLEEDLMRERAAKFRGEEYGFVHLIKDPRVYALGATMFGGLFLGNANQFWGPLLIQASGIRSILNIGLLAAIPPAFGVIVMLAASKHSDMRRERRWHFACAQFAAAAALVLASIYYDQPTVVILALSIVAGGFFTTTSVFNSIPLIYLSERTRAGGTAFISMMGSTGAMVAPIMMGLLRQHTGSFSLGLQLTAVLVAASGVLLLVSIPARLLREE
jgi:MFS family permease